jgi:hypothetical protein
MDAASEGHLDTLQALLQAGADPSASNEVRSRVMCHVLPVTAVDLRTQRFVLYNAVRLDV